MSYLERLLSFPNYWKLTARYTGGFPVRTAPPQEVGTEERAEDPGGLVQRPTEVPFAVFPGAPKPADLC